jgi:hypothetical protein
MCRVRLTGDRESAAISEKAMDNSILQDRGWADGICAPLLIMQEGGHRVIFGWLRRIPSLQ